MNQKATPVKAWMNGLRFRVPPRGGILKKKAPRLSSRGAPQQLDINIIEMLHIAMELATGKNRPGSAHCI